jgi:AmmeMemoRadiSam system protein A
MIAPLSPEQRRALLAMARQSIADHLAGRPPVRPPLDDIFARRSGVFVSLHNHGELRGCIGYPDGERPLGATVPSCAVSAATGDPRFNPVTVAELPEIDIEISVLTPVEPVTDPVDIEVGRDGLIVEQRGRRGLLLPQVATEWGWDRDTFLAQTCVKAGLPRDAWKHGASVFRFQAEVFGERR